MAEYIERERARREFALYFRDSERLVDECDSLLCYLLTADVVEVVRCKDCRHAYINAFSAQSGIAVCKFWSNRSKTEIIGVQHDDYCSYGAKMDGKGE